MIIQLHYTTDQARQTVRAVHIAGGLTPEQFHVLDDVIRTVEQAQAPRELPRVYRPALESTWR